MEPLPRHPLFCRFPFCEAGRPNSSASRPLPQGGPALALATAKLAATLLVAFVIVMGIPSARAQSGPNSDPNYVALRNITLGSEAVSVTNLDLKRDAGRFRLNSGTVCFVPPVNGKVTGAVFAGEGTFQLNPPSEAERKNLKY